MENLMFELNKIHNLEDTVEQLSTVSDTITEEASFVTLTVVHAFETLFKNAWNLEQINIVIDGLVDEEHIQELQALRHYLPTTTEINVMALGFNPKDELYCEENITVQNSPETLPQVLKRSRELRFDIHAIFLFNFNDQVFFNWMKENLLQPYLRGINTKFFVTHNSDEIETPRLLSFKRYNMNEQHTFTNRFALDELGKMLASRVSLLSTQSATRNAGYVEAEPTLTKVFNNTYFNPAFHSFGLHYNHKNEGIDLKVIFFDYKLCYDPFNFVVYSLENGKFTEITRFQSDPFSILTRTLQDADYRSDQPDIYISLSDKESAAKLRLHFGYIIKARFKAFRDEAILLLEKEGIEATEERINLNTKNVAFGHPLRDAKASDVKAYKLFHHFFDDFVEAVKTNKELYIAQDLGAKPLIYEIAANDKFNGLLIDFVHNSHELNFDLNQFDACGFTLLDEAAANGATKNMETLIKRGANINFQNPFGFTALHRAYASNSQEAKAVLTKHGARIMKNVFGQTPQDIVVLD